MEVSIYICNVVRYSYYFVFIAGYVRYVQSAGRKMFDVVEYRFKAYDQPCVVRMSPYIRTNADDENSAHAMLLVYVPWPLEGESNLLRGCETAVEAFATLRKAEQLPLHLLK